MPLHPANDILGIKSDKLKGKKIVLGVTGSIAATETVKLARELIRHGADVIPVMTKSAQEIIGVKSLHFATGHMPITEISGDVEHVMYCGAREEKADALLIAPATGNTISKIACGIDDTPVTTFATTAIGTGIPVMIVPAMHESMYRHAILQENIKKLEHLGIHIIQPRFAEHKAKFPDIDEIVAHTIRILGKNDYQNKRVLVIGGASVEYIDEMRVITNLSTGKMSVALANEAFYRGAEVMMYAGRMEVPVPGYLPTKRFDTVENLLELTKKINYDYIFVPAALSDFYVEPVKGKIPSDKEITLHLKPLPKVIRHLRERTRGKIIGFKAEPDCSDAVLFEKAFKVIKSTGIDGVCANTFANVGKDHGEILYINSRGEMTKIKGTKEEIAQKIFDRVLLL